MRVILGLVLLIGLVQARPFKYVMYLTGQHDIVPSSPLVSDITHVALAFMPVSIFNQVEPPSWPLFDTVSSVRSKFADGTAIMVAIGGWGDTASFSTAAATQSSRKLFAENVKKMVEQTGADGVDIDWEYPGGNGEDYKQTPNSEKAWEIEAYPVLLEEIRSALGPNKLMSAAVPGKPGDMIAFTKSTIPSIMSSLDFLNIMTYDLLNRRDAVTRHHTGLALSLDGINAYLENGVAPEQANLGFAFYVRWAKTDPNSNCSVCAVGCKTALMEDLSTGADLGRAGAFSWHDSVPPELSTSFHRALDHGQYDPEEGGHYYWDSEEDLFWSWDTPDTIALKFPAIVDKLGLGGVFAWGLGEDCPEWSHLKALTAGVVSSKQPKEEHKSHIIDEL